MKNLKAIMLLFLGLVLVACSSDDGNSNQGPSDCDAAIANIDIAFTNFDLATPEDENYVSLCTNYQNALQDAIDLCGDVLGTYQDLIDNLDCTLNFFPLTVDDFWIYNVENMNADDPVNDFTAIDLITVNSFTAGGYTVEANNGNSPATGSMNSFLVNGSLLRTDDMLVFNGDLALPEAFSGFSDATIALTDAALYDLNAADGELSNTPGTINQDIDLNGTVVPLTIDYTLTTNKLSTEFTLMVDGTLYTNVIKGNLSLEVTVIGTLPVLGDTNIINTQDVLSIDYYFAVGVGLIKADAVQGYAVADSFLAILAAFPDLVLPVPTSVSVTNVQELDSYIVAE